MTPDEARALQAHRATVRSQAHKTLKDELIARCRRKGLDHSGIKLSLVERLVEHFAPLPDDMTEADLSLLATS
jgi:hypothetical protein